MFKNVFWKISLALTILCAVFADTVFAQDFVLRGVVFQKQNGQRISNALITDLKTRILSSSNDLGGFSIKTSVGDTIKISKKDLTEYFYTVTGQQDLIIQLTPIIQLDEVKVVSQSKKQELDEAMKKYRGQGSYYNGKPPVSSFSPLGGSPLTGLYELFGKTPKQAKHFQQFAKLENEQLLVDKRFNREIIKEFTDLKDEQIQPFMDSYRPTSDQIAGWSQYDLINYIKKSAQGFKEGKGLPPLQKLY